MLIMDSLMAQSILPRALLAVGELAKMGFLVNLMDWAYMLPMWKDYSL
jgi:hypothetical protein